jgi:predicted transcriptional regulator
MTDTLPLVCKIFGNEVRFRILMLLEKEPRTFGDLLKRLVVNPKVLNDSLTILSKHRIIAKSYPYNVYTLTPTGHVVKQGLLALAEELNRVADPLHLEK